MKRLLIALCAMAAIVGCHKDKEPDTPEQPKATRTVLVYISGENSLYDFIDDELAEMKQGSTALSTTHNLLVYVDRARSSELPWLARIANGEITDSVSLADMNISYSDEYASNPRIMESVLRYAFTQYPARNDDYGLVLWGHASGWIIQDSIPYTAMARQRAFGVDNGSNSNSDTGKWLNMPTLAKLLSKLPHLTFIFADCCNFQCLESAYELRHVCDYIIGSPAEIPGEGAPYNTVVPAMFEPTTFYTSIVDKYFAQHAWGLDVPLSVVKTSEMDNLASATRTLLSTFAPDLGIYPDLSGLIYYYYDWSSRKEFYDANDFMLQYAQANDYTAWKQALDRAVVYKKMATQWVTNKEWTYYYTDFTITPERFSGVSMFIPQYAQRASDNLNIRKLSWYYAAGYDSVGW